MKKLLKLLLAMFAIVGVACTPNNEGNGGENNDPTPALTFTIQLSDITASTVKMAVTPSNDTDTYFFDVVETSVLSHYSSPKAFVTDYISQLKAIYEEYGISLSDVLSQGPDSWEYEEGQLESNTDYYAFAFGVTAEGVVSSEVTMESFKTLEQAPSGPSDNELSVSVSRVTATGALVSVTPSNNDTYYFATKLFDEVNHRLSGSACCYKIVYDQNLLTRFDGILMHFDGCCTVFQCILFFNCLARKFAFLTNEHKWFMIDVCDWSTKNKSSGFWSHYYIKVQIFNQVLHGIDSEAKAICILQYACYVSKNNTFLREIRNASYIFFQFFHVISP
jgi:hypothetical protein